MSSQYIQELGIVVKADGTLELTNGMKLMQVSVEGAASALDTLDKSVKDADRSEQALATTGKAAAVSTQEVGQAAEKASTSVEGLGAAVDQSNRKLEDAAQQSKALSDGQTTLGSTSDTAGKKLDDLGASGAGAARALDNLENAAREAQQAEQNLETTGKTTATTTRELGQAATTTATAVDQLGDAADQTGKKLDDAARKGKTAADEQKSLGGQSDEAGRKLVDLSTKSDGATNAQQRLGNTAKQTAAAFRMLPAQITDVVTSIASGMPIWLVAIQQGGQIKDSFGGIGPAFKAIAGAIPPLYAGLGGLTAVAAGVALAYKQGSDEADAYYRGIVMTGNAAGVTTAQLQDMAKAASMQGSSTGTQGKNAEVIAQMVASGEIAKAVFEDASAAAIELERLAGKSISSTIDDLADLGKAPVEASEKLNNRYHYLTAAVYEQIRALQEQGREDEAAALAQRTYTDAFAERAKQLRDNLGSIERAWYSGTDAAKRWWDALLNIGRDDTPGDQIASLTNQIDGLEAALARVEANGGKLGTGLAGRVNPQWIAQQRSQLEALKAHRSALVEDGALMNRSADAQATEAARQQARITWLQEEKKYLTTRQRLYQEHQEEVAKINQTATAGGFTDEERQTRLDQENARYKKALTSATAGETSKADQVSRAGLERDVAAIDARYKTLTAATANAERILDAQRSAGLVSESDYYAQKRTYVQQSADLEVKALQEQNARFASQQATGAEKIANDRKVAENASEMARVQAKAQTDLTILTLQEKSAYTQRKASLQSFMATQEEYLAGMQRQWDRQTQAMTLSSRGQEYLSGLNAIDDRFRDARRDLEQARSIAMIQDRWQSSDEEGYRARLQSLQRFQAQATQIYSEEFEKQSALQEQWLTGAIQGYADFQESARNVAVGIRDVFYTSLDGLADRFVDLAMTGKASFEDLARSAVASLLKIQIQQGMVAMAGGASGWLSSLMGAATTAYTGSSATSAGTSMKWDSAPTSGTFAVAHTGGIIGHDTLATRSANPAIWASPPRFHTGGIVGDEVPIIAKRKEGVFTQEQMKALAPVGAMGAPPVTIINQSSQKVTATARTTQGVNGAGMEIVLRDMIENAVADSISNGGSVGQAISGRWNVQERVF